jgi:glycosyltransferase involved in cell wall biosynthesis
MTPRRFCFVLSSLWLSGGVRLVIEYANGLARRGHAITLVTPRGTVDPALRQMLAANVQLRESTLPLPTGRNPVALARLAWSLARTIPASDILVATHTPTIVPTLLAARRGRQVHTAWLYMDYEEMFRERPVERFLLRHGPRWFGQIWAISRPLQQTVAPRTRAPVVMTGGGPLNAHLFADQTCSPSTADEQRILYVGDPRPRKGLHEYVEAVELLAARLPRIKPVIVSKEPCPIDLSIPHDFHLLPSDAQLAELYRSSDLFISTSWGEGLGYPPLEAMTCGTPTVITNSQGVLDYARDGQNCLVVPPRDAAAVAVAAERILSDAQLAARLVCAGLATAEQYSWDAVIDRVEATVERLLLEQPPGESRPVSRLTGD